MGLESTVTRHSIKYLGRGLTSQEHADRMANNMGFENSTDYRDHLSDRRAQRPEVKAFVHASEEKLKKLKRTYTWLGERTGTTVQSVWNCVNYRSLPDGDVLKRWCHALGLPHGYWAFTLRPKRIIGNRFGEYVNRRLANIGRSKAWLAETVGAHSSAVTYWTKGRMFPRDHVMRNVFKVLESPYQTLYEFAAGECPELIRKFRVS